MIAEGREDVNVEETINIEKRESDITRHSEELGYEYGDYDTSQITSSKGADTMQTEQRSVGTNGNMREIESDPKKDKEDQGQESGTTMVFDAVPKEKANLEAESQIQQQQDKPLQDDDITKIVVSEATIKTSGNAAQTNEITDDDDDQASESTSESASDTNDQKPKKLQNEPEIQSNEFINGTDGVKLTSVQREALKARQQQASKRNETGNVVDQLSDR